MEVSIAQYARIHGISLRTAYRRVGDKGEVEAGDCIVSRAGHRTVNCIHARSDTARVAKVGNDMPMLPKARLEGPDDSSPVDAFDHLIQAISQLGITNALEIDHIVGRWETLSLPSKRALMSINGALIDYVDRNRLREIWLRRRVEREGRKRQGISSVGCASFDREELSCRAFKDRRSGLLFKPTDIDCALCPHYRRASP